ncbi:hypothetical protein ACTG0T_15325 (plasmid) [Halococcus morrhuae DSM 1307]|uniref:hypothetical protein n=1 Tax=Halococcus morrhuae TaxID=2250 RepID=UPI0012673DB5|nr:hypothetical protein [Halococcus morrhuae]
MNEGKQTNISGVSWQDYANSGDTNQTELTGIDWENRTVKERETLDVDLPLTMEQDGDRCRFEFVKNLRSLLKEMGFASKLFYDLFLDIADHGRDSPLLIVVPISYADLETAHQPRKVYWDPDHGSRLRLPSHIVDASYRTVGNLKLNPESYSNDNRLVFKAWAKQDFFALYPTQYENGQEYHYRCIYPKMAKYSPF